MEYREIIPSQNTEFWQIGTTKSRKSPSKHCPLPFATNSESLRRHTGRHPAEEQTEGAPFGNHDEKHNTVTLPITMFEEHHTPVILDRHQG